MVKQDAHTQFLLLISKGNDLKRGGNYNKRASVVYICPKKMVLCSTIGNPRLGGKIFFPPQTTTNLCCVMLMIQR